MNRNITIEKQIVSPGSRTYIIAEMSGNHNMSFERAAEIVMAAKKAGADAIKLQTYTADTITLDCDKSYFMTQSDSLWSGTTLYKLYEKAYTPWEWQPKLKQLADEIGITLFSSPFDLTSVDFLEKMNVPAYKVASFEINDIPLIKKMAGTGKPIIISTGIAKLEDIQLAIETCRKEGNENVILLKCTSAYPAPYEDMNINVIPNMSETFDCLVGLSDHSMGDEVAIAAVALGAKVIEKHVTLSRSDGGVDAEFSMEIDEFAEMVRKIRNIEKALGKVTYELTQKQLNSREGSRSLFIAEDIKKGQEFTAENVKSVRPGNGMHTKHYFDVLGKVATCDLEKGTPLEWKYIKEK